MPKLGALNVNIINANNSNNKIVFAILPLHLKLLIISLYDIYSPNADAIKNEIISKNAMFLPNIPVYV